MWMTSSSGSCQPPTIGASDGYRPQRLPTRAEPRWAAAARPGSATGLISFVDVIRVQIGHGVPVGLDGFGEDADFAPSSRRRYRIGP